jgi:hypothetical protein
MYKFLGGPMSSAVRFLQAYRTVVTVLAAVLVVAGGCALIGATSKQHVVTVSRPTTATVDPLWALWADPANSPRWDRAVQSSTHDGPFATGQTGTVTLKDQPSRRFEIIDCQPKTTYTDRFFLPAGGKMDWRHTITDSGSERTVTFEIHVSGPTALVLRPILASVLEAELPATVDTFVRVAEADTNAAR